MYIMPLNSYFLAPSAIRISRATNGIEGIVLLSAFHSGSLAARALWAPGGSSVLRPLAARAGKKGVSW